MRLFALYGMGSFSLSLNDWCVYSPEWLEVRPIELPGHGWREAEPLAFSKGSSSEIDWWSARWDTLQAARRAFVNDLCDSIVPLLNVRYALYGFSNGAMLAYLIALELERRGAPLPCRVFCSGRGAPHLHKWSDNRVAKLLQWSDSEVLEWAEKGSILPPALMRQGMKVNPRFAPVCRSGAMGLFAVGQQPENQDERSLLDADVYLAELQPLRQISLTALLSDADEMWPSSRYLAKWSEVTDANFTGITIVNVPHHMLQSDKSLRTTVFDTLADGLGQLTT